MHWPTSIDNGEFPALLPPSPDGSKEVRAAMAAGHEEQRPHHKGEATICTCRVEKNSCDLVSFLFRILKSSGTVLGPGTLVRSFKEEVNNFF